MSSGQVFWGLTARGILDGRSIDERLILPVMWYFRVASCSKKDLVLERVLNNKQAVVQSSDKLAAVAIQDMTIGLYLDGC